MVAVVEPVHSLCAHELLLPAELHDPAGVLASAAEAVTLSSEAGLVPNLSRT